MNGDGVFEESDAWRLIAEHSRDLVLLLDLSGRILYASPSHLPILGIDPSSLIGAPASEHIHPDDREVQREAFRRRLETGNSQGVDIRVRKADGDYLMVESLGAPIRNDEGEVQSIVISARDISARHDAERKLIRSQERYRVIFERNLAGVYRSTLDGRLLECNPAFARMLGFDSVEEVLQISTWDLYFSRNDREVLIETLTEQNEMHNFEICLRKKDGSPVWVLQNDAMVHDTEDGMPYMEGTIVDITDRKNAEERIEHQAYHDHLTDLPNRLLFHDRLSLAVANARGQGDRLTVMFLDLDHFKLINDTMAHSAGDELLRKVAATLQSVLRTEDTVARMGGDEFTILLPHVKDENEAAKVAQGILDALIIPFYIQGREVFVSGSIGVSMFPSDGDHPETLIRNADSAMYRAKDAGRNNFQFHTPLAQHRAEVRLSMETALRHAHAGYGPDHRRSSPAQGAGRLGFDR
ncbi:MAG TPA: diguanylate cyclase [Thermoanaerobaculia bacterium]|nr:diguanylate cyclase [Thermoanaerobaculia bacterium]